MHGTYIHGALANLKYEGLVECVMMKLYVFTGSAAPIKSTFGNIYQKDKMYSIEVPVQGQELDSESESESEQDSEDAAAKDRYADSFLLP